MKKITLKEVIKQTAKTKHLHLQFLVLSDEDWYIATWCSEEECFEFGGGRFDGDVLTPDEVSEIYELPHSSGRD